MLVDEEIEEEVSGSVGSLVKRDAQSIGLDVSSLAKKPTAAEPPAAQLAMQRPTLPQPSKPPLPPIAKSSSSLSYSSSSSSASSAAAAAAAVTRLPSVPPKPPSAISTAPTQPIQLPLNITTKPAGAVARQDMWNVLDVARFNRALLRFGINFSSISKTVSTKTWSQVKAFYHGRGGSNGFQGLLLSEHRRLKNIEGALSRQPLAFSAEEEALILQGRYIDRTLPLPKPDQFSLGSDAVVHIDTNNAAAAAAAVPVEQRRKKVDLILRSNNRGIFTTEDGMQPDTIKDVK